MTRQRSEQKGKSGSLASTILRHVGQRSDEIFFFVMGQISRFRVTEHFYSPTLAAQRSERVEGGAPIRGTQVLQQSCDQIVIVGFFHDGAMEAAGLRRLVVSEIVDEHFAVDLRSVGRGASLPEQIGLLAGTFEHDLDLAANPLLAALTADALLQLHELAAAALDFLGRNFVCEEKRGRAFLVGVGEDSEPVKLGGGNEVAELLEIIFGLAGKADDERGAQGEVGDGLRASWR